MLAPRIDRVINICKWPVALLALFFLPGSILATVNLCVAIGKAPQHALTFLAGFLVYSIVWWAYVRRWRTSFLSTLEHELTHAVFAILTLHRVTRLRATWASGGHMRFDGGEGNWLITTAPYFFPTVSLALVLVFLFLPHEYSRWFNPLLGLSVGYHVWSTMRETHAGQTDLKKVGWLFAMAFLPTANIVTHGVVLAYADAGRGAIVDFAVSVWRQTADIYGL